MQQFPHVKFSWPWNALWPFIWCFFYAAPNRHGAKLGREVRQAVFCKDMHMFLHTRQRALHRSVQMCKFNRATVWVVRMDQAVTQKVDSTTHLRDWFKTTWCKTSTTSSCQLWNYSAIILTLYIGFEDFFWSKCSDYSLLMVNIFFFFFNSMTVSWISLGCWRNKTLEDVVTCSPLPDIS